MRGWRKAVVGSRVGGIAFLVFHACTSQAAIRDDGHAYFEALRDDRLDEAYRLLATETRQRVSREAFETEMYTPKLRRASDASFYNVKVSSAGRGCLEGGIAVGDEGESFYLYMQREGESWRVHSITFESYLNDSRWVLCR